MLMVTLIFGLSIGYFIGAGRVNYNNRRRIAKYKRFLKQKQDEHYETYKDYYKSQWNID